MPVNQTKDKARAERKKSDEDRNLDEALEESFPARDPPAPAQPAKSPEDKKAPPRSRPEPEKFPRDK